jgi:hypothetical protein
VEAVSTSDAAVERLRSALDEDVTKSLPLADWACDPLSSCPYYAHVNPDWLRAVIAEARRVREVLAEWKP